MVNSILKWSDAKMEKLTNNPDEEHAFAKAFGLGAIEGAIDGFVFLGALAFVGSIVSMVKK